MHCFPSPPPPPYLIWNNTDAVEEEQVPVYTHVHTLPNWGKRALKQTWADLGHASDIRALRSSVQTIFLLDPEYLIRESQKYHGHSPHSINVTINPSDPPN